jgi:hypothetical protein
MKPAELLKSGEYRDAKDRVKAWMERLGKADAKEAVRVRDEKVVFFRQMREKRPDLYAAFQIDDKTLSEAIYKKLTGKDIIID